MFITIKLTLLGCIFVLLASCIEKALSSIIALLCSIVFFQTGNHDIALCVDVCEVIVTALTFWNTGRVLGTRHVRMCIHTRGRFCLFIFGNGFVGISDLSLTGTQTDITSCTQILARCRSVEGNYCTCTLGRCL